MFNVSNLIKFYIFQTVGSDFNNLYKIIKKIDKEYQEACSNKMNKYGTELYYNLYDFNIMNNIDDINKFQTSLDKDKNIKNMVDNNIVNTNYLTKFNQVIQVYPSVLNNQKIFIFKSDKIFSSDFFNILKKYLNFNYSIDDLIIGNNNFFKNIETNIPITFIFDFNSRFILDDNYKPDNDLRIKEQMFNMFLQVDKYKNLSEIEKQKLKKIIYKNQLDEFNIIYNKIKSKMEKMELINKNNFNKIDNKI